MRPPEWLWTTLACPECKGPLSEPDAPAGSVAGQERICVWCRLAYPLRDGVPWLLAEAARPLSG